MSNKVIQILLIDDNPGDAELASEWLGLEAAGSFEIAHVKSLGEGMRWLSSQPVDVVLLDLNLPDSRGLSSLHRLRPAAGRAPVIVVSGEVDELLRSQARAAGADDILSKDEIHSRLFSRSVLYALERRLAVEQHERLERLLDATPDAMFVLSRSGAVLYLNRAAQALFDGSNPSYFGELLLSSRPAGECVEVTVPSADGERFCEMRVAPMNWSGERSHLATVRDVTESRRAEILRRRSAELQDENRRVEAASRMKSEFLANMSHEVRTPMNAVIGLAYLLKQTRLDEEQTDLLEKLDIASRALLGLIDNVLDLSKIEAGQLVLEAVDFSLHELLGEVTQMIRPLAEVKGLDLVVLPTPAAPALLRGDVTRVRQVLLNLLANAVKFTERGQVELGVTLTPAPAGRVMLECRVRDTGIGIAPLAQARLFTAFTQADASTTRRYGGSGLGLSIVRRVAELMGGSVGMSSVPGAGSEFWARLGLAVSEPGVAGHSRGDAAALFKARAAGDRWLVGVRLLLVDDSEVNLDVAGRVLRQQGAQVTAFNRAGPALEALRRDPGQFDLVLMDVQMPDMDGCEAARALRAEPACAQLPIIALTAGVLVSERDRALASGMDEVLCKPFDPADLVCTVRRQVERAQPLSVQRSAVSGELAGSVEAWPALAGIDPEQARLRLSNDAGLFRATLARILAEDISLLCAFDGTPAQRPAVAARMHRLRGSFGVVGAGSLQALAQAAELALNGGSAADDVRATLQVLAAEFDALRARAGAAGLLDASPRTRSRPNPDDRPADEGAYQTTNNAADGLDAEAIAGLERALKQQSLSARALLDKLAVPLQRQLGDLQFDALDAALDRFDFALASRVLSRLRAPQAPLT